MKYNRPELYAGQFEHLWLKTEGVQVPWACGPPCSIRLLGLRYTMAEVCPTIIEPCNDPDGCAFLRLEPQPPMIVFAGMVSAYNLAVKEVRTVKSFKDWYGIDGEVEWQARFSE